MAFAVASSSSSAISGPFPRSSASSEPKGTFFFP